MNFLVYFFIIHLLIFLPGYVLSSKLKIFKEQLEILIFGYIISISLFSIIAVSYYFLGYDISLLKVFSLCIFVSTFYFFVKDRLYLKFQTLTPLVFLVVFSLTSLLYASLPYSRSLNIIPDPYPIEGRHYKSFNVKILNLAQTPANDNSVPYRQAQFFVNRLDIDSEPFIAEWGVNFFFRTPLMGAVTAYFFDLEGEELPNEYIWQADLAKYNDSYIKYQIISSILNSLFILPGFLLIRKLFDLKVANFTLVFTFFNAYFLYNTFFSWPKLFIAFFILFCWYLLVSKKNYLLVGLISGLAYYAHDLTVLYVAGMIAFLMFSKNFKYLFVYGVSFILTIAPWYLISRIVYHQSSLFLYYPFFLNGIPPEPKAAIKEFLNTSVFQIIKIKLDYLANLMAPYYLIVSDKMGFAKDVYLSTIFTLPGAIGVNLFIFSYFAVIKMFKRSWIEITSFILIPILLSVILIGNPKGIISAMHYLEPIVLLMIGMGIYMIRKSNKVVMSLVFLLGIAQYFLVFFYNYNFSTSGWLENSSLLSLLTLVCVYLGVTIYFLTLLHQVPLKTFWNKLRS